MDVLSVLLIIELIILGLLGILELVGMMIAKGAEDQDPIFVFCSTFWREFLWPPADMPARGAPVIARGRSSGSSPRQVTDDDETYGRIMKTPRGPSISAN
jgi:hypothetical protein